VRELTGDVYLANPKDGKVLAPMKLALTLCAIPVMKWKRIAKFAFEAAMLRKKESSQRG
jgi:isocitrate/isopropylmalate dehydrogenase